VVAALTFSNAMFDAKVSAIWSDAWDQEFGNGWAVAAGVTVNVGASSKFLVKGAYGAAPWVVGTTGENAIDYADQLDFYEPTWMVMASFIHNMSPDLWVSVTANYISGTDYNYDNYDTALQAQFALGYQAAPNFWLKPAVTWIHYRDSDGYDVWSDWVFTLRVQRDFGDK